MRQGTSNSRNDRGIRTRQNSGVTAMVRSAHGAARPARCRGQTGLEQIPPVGASSDHLAARKHRVLQHRPSSSSFSARHPRRNGLRYRQRLRSASRKFFTCAIRRHDLQSSTRRIRANTAAGISFQPETNRPADRFRVRSRIASAVAVVEVDRQAGLSIPEGCGRARDGAAFESWRVMSNRRRPIRGRADGGFL